MRFLRPSRLLGRMAGCTALTLGVAGMAAAPARARAAGNVSQPHAVASWGNDDNGQLGNGTTIPRALYGDVIGLPNDMVQVSAGDSHTLALRPDGTVWAWGSNISGGLGDGSDTDRSTPVQVTGLTGVIQVAAGLRHSLALRSDGTVWAWSANSAGQAGIGVTSPEQLAPVQVTGLTGVTKISAGSNFSLALRSDGTIWAGASIVTASSGTAPRPTTARYRSRSRACPM
jgi:alpha-tubulin suppressor-like RCC1 family protein